jgi:signal peptidase II
MTDAGPRRSLVRDVAALGVTAAAVVAVDQATKALVIASLGVGERVHVIGDLVMLWHVQNRGGAFSLFQGSMLLFYVVTVLALVMIVYFHRTLRAGGLWVQVVLGMILGGTLGNLTDRLRLGYVTDFVSMGIGDLRWPTYNVADASLVVGIITLVGYLMLNDPRRSEAAT